MTVGENFDVNALNDCSSGGRHEGKNTKMIAIEKAFHGGQIVLQISHSCKDGYDRNLKTFQNRENLKLYLQII